VGVTNSANWSFLANEETFQYVKEQADAVSGIPPGLVLKSITYGGKDLLREPLAIGTSGTAELVITPVLEKAVVI
jgi:hypothetical protein